jgi:hypothetical protein
MATLLDALKKNLSGVGAPTEPATDETGTVRSLLAAKKGIVGGTPSTPRGLSIAEAAAKGQTQQQLAEVGQAAKMQSTAIEQAATGQQMEQQQREQVLQGQKEERNLRNRIETENILQQLEQGKQKLSEQQRQAGLERATALLRFQNQDYITTLQREGDKARLKEGYNFSEQMAKDVMNNNQVLLQSRLGQMAIRDASDRQFDKTLAQMGIDEAIRIAKEESSNAQRQAQIGTAVEAGKVGVQAYGTYKSGGFSSDYKTYADGVREQGGTPISYTAWQQRQGSTAAKGNQPASGYGRGYGEV